MSASGLPGETKNSILAILADGPATTGTIAPKCGVTTGSAAKHLANMEQSGEVVREYLKGSWFWSLSGAGGSAAQVVGREPSYEPQVWIGDESVKRSSEQPDRVRLAEELVEIERMLLEATARRAEILEALK